MTSFKTIKMFFISTYCRYSWHADKFYLRMKVAICQGACTPNTKIAVLWVVT